MNKNAKPKPSGNGAVASGAEPFKAQYQECGDGLYLPDFRVRMPDGRIYTIAGIQGDYPDELSATSCGGSLMRSSRSGICTTPTCLTMPMCNPSPSAPS